MSAAVVTVLAQAGKVALIERGPHEVRCFTLTASQAERVAREMEESAARIMAHPLYETLPEDQR